MPKYSPYIEFMKSLQKRDNDPLKRKETEKTLKLIDWFAHVVLNSLSAHIAILDETGIIIQTNQAWREFAESNEIGIIDLAHRTRSMNMGIVYQHDNFDIYYETLSIDSLILFIISPTPTRRLTFNPANSDK